MNNRARKKNTSKPSLEEEYCNKIIGTRIELHRKQKEMSQKDLAKLIDVSRVTISHIESGRIMLSVYKLIRLSKALKISYISLIKNIK